MKKVFIGSLLAAVMISAASCPSPLIPANLSILKDLNPPRITVETPSQGSQFRSKTTFSGTITEIDAAGAARTSGAGLIQSLSYIIENHQTKPTEISPAADGRFIFSIDTSIFDKQISVL